MRSIVCTGRGDASVLEYVTDEPIPQISSPDDVLVKIHFCAVNPIDYKLREGWIPGRSPRILGYDFAGIVSEAGSEATEAGFVPGTRVFGMQEYRKRGFGCYAEFAVVKVGECALIPEGMPFDAASAVPLVCETVWQMFLKAGLSERGQLRGQSMLVIGGSGGTGSWAIMLGTHYFEAERVYAVASARNAEYMSSLGAHVPIDYREQDFVEVITNAREEEEESFPHLRLVLDCLGGREVSNRCCSLLSPTDFFVSIGLPSKGETVALFAFHMPWKKIRHVFGRGPCWNWVAVHANGAHLAQAVEGVGPERIAELIPLTTFRLEQIREAHAQIETHRTVGKIVIEVAEASDENEVQETAIANVNDEEEEVEGEQT